MTQPKHSPFRFHFVNGITELNDVKPHLKREHGWVPNGCKKTRGSSTKKRHRRK